MKLESLRCSTLNVPHITGITNDMTPATEVPHIVKHDLLKILLFKGRLIMSILQ